ncbi:MAG: rhomboid family intramembrane serine protease [Flavobacteriales bacterium]|nr:rhomboid family intramembrane serine protease [Flavobacteriales bacterium]
MSTYRTPLGGMLPTVVKNLLIINGLFFLARYSFGSDDLGRNLLDTHLGMYYIGSPHFRPWQVLTHMFMHGGFTHIFFNMFALWMFGAPIEHRLGSRRFLSYYMICGIGAAALHTAVNAYEVTRDEQTVMEQGVAPSEVKDAAAATTIVDAERMLNDIAATHDVSQTALEQLYFDYQGIIIGASGAVFGILLAFGMLFPNQEILMLFFPVPIKAKYFVAIYGIIELFMGIRQGQGDNVAHFAHVGGMIFGYFLLRHWKRKEPWL